MSPCVAAPRYSQDTEDQPAACVQAEAEAHLKVTDKNVPLQGLQQARAKHGASWVCGGRFLLHALLSRMATFL